MKHYAIILQESIKSNDTYFSSHYMAEGVGNLIPELSEITDNIETEKKLLLSQGFKFVSKDSKLGYITVEEVGIYDIAALSFLYYNTEGRLKYSTRLFWDYIKPRIKD